ncbi:hypothetical protein N7539_007173 [Penicillium diatomitis]|uniref:BZIP domain-containing protein n=1 Tax=Penicillium diatomitis TaxID=2819901 RepID=A0A9W9WUP3_9EURO|nr:uncharacterized protein N7539_007173 [Penicillium diatomitis]KAJ5477029.1 hypothetical protein N7539_007173 [Penicillium diatomitis]
MDVESSQKNVDRLARIRENQRKSRARKQEYVRELEQRLLSYKNDAQQKDIQHRLATQKLEAENRQLKALLGSLGISAESIQQYLQLAHRGMAFNQKVAIPAMQRPTEPRAPSPSGLSETDRRIDSKRTSVSNQQQQQPYPYPQAAESQLEPPSQQEQQSQQETQLRPLLLQKQPEGLSHPAEQQRKENNPSFCQCGPGDDLPAGEGDLLNTTLCGMAEELINQYNTVGIDIDEIRKMLWAGFKAGATGDGCRVENQVLFQVLDEISNGI